MFLKTLNFLKNLKVSKLVYVFPKFLKTFKQALMKFLRHFLSHVYSKIMYVNFQDSVYLFYRKLTLKTGFYRENIILCLKTASSNCS